MDIRIGSVDPTSPSQWLRRRRNFQSLGDLKTLRICIVYGTRKETTQQEITASSLINMQEKGKKDKEEDNQKKDEDNPEDKGFQQSKGTVAVIFSGVLGSRSKHQDKLALRSIMAAEPAIPRYLNWSPYPIQFSREDQCTSVGNASLYHLFWIQLLQE
jgi:hypothetical protein